MRIASLMSSMPHRPQPTRPSRLRLAMRPRLSLRLSDREIDGKALFRRQGENAAISVARGDDALGERKADGEILEIGGRRHHHGVGSAS